MIIFANGAVKSGSTWLFQIVLELTGFGPPPASYANPAWTSRPVYSIDPSRLNEFLISYKNESGNILSKNHFSSKEERDCLLSQHSVRVLNIRRDIRDVVVSAYYHNQIKTGEKMDFKTYYWNQARFFVPRSLDYQIIWNIHSRRYLSLEYASLLSNFSHEVEKMARFLDISVSNPKIERIRQVTTPESLNQRYGFSDFNRARKGIVGDWQNHLDKEIENDIRMIQLKTQNPLHHLALTGSPMIRHLCRRWRFILKEHPAAK